MRTGVWCIVIVLLAAILVVAVGFLSIETFFVRPAMLVRPKISPTRSTVYRWVKSYVKNESKKALLGVVKDSHRGAIGRKIIQQPYVDALCNTKVVVICSPNGWEGDSRTPEAISSGAAVVYSKLLRPTPGLDPRLSFGTQKELHKLLRKVLRNPAKYVRAPYTPKEMVTHVVKTMALRDDAKIALADDLAVLKLSEIHRKKFDEYGRFPEFETFESGVAGLRRAAPSIEQADAVVFITQRLSGNENYPEHALDWVRSKAVQGKALAIADFSDDPNPCALIDQLADHATIFKRSMVDRKIGKLTSAAHKCHPIWYSVRDEFARRVNAAKKPMGDREVDIAYLYNRRNN